MALFRRREPLHERLAREGGLRLGTEPPLDPRPPTLEAGIHGLQRPRDWDATVTVRAEGLDGDEAVFVALPDGSLLVEDGSDSSLGTLAEAVERELSPPYRARAVRQDGSLWSVQARRIEVLELPDAPDGDTLELSRTEEGSTLLVDGERATGAVSALEQRGARAGRDYAVRAERLDGDLWEVRASPL